MENASKALIIAGSVLIAIMILALGVYLVGGLEQTADSYTTEVEITEIRKYNSKFEVYVGRKDIMAQDIITVISMAQHEQREIKVYIDGVDCTNYTEEQKNKFLSENILTYNSDGTTNNLYSYDEQKCPIKYNSQGMVIQIGFRKNS